jgi:glutamyl-tRNA synthetase
VKLGQVAQPLRVALTGSTQARRSTAVLHVLGRARRSPRILAAADG